MSTQANLKGGFLKTLTVSRTASSTSTTTLKDDFLKKTENYVCQIPRFIMNNATKLSLIEERMFEIRMKDNPGVDASIVNFPDEWNRADFQFTAKPYRTWVELARQMERFFHRFGVIAELIGFPGYEDEERLDPGDIYPYTNVGVQDEVISYEELLAEDIHDNAEGRHINFTLDDDGRFTLEFDRWFSQHFYVMVGPQTQIKTGFPQYMFVTRRDDASHATHQDGIDELFTDAEHGDFSFADILDNAVAAKRKFTSTHPLENFDDRLSIDCICTFPLSAQISAFDGKEEHEWILARFAIADYEKNTSEVIVSQGRLQNVNVMKELLKIGLQDLTNNNPDYTSIFLLPGKIRHVNVKLVTRYLSNGKIVTIPTDMRDGTWEMKLLFSKKKT